MVAGEDSTLAPRPAGARTTKLDGPHWRRSAPAEMRRARARQLSAGRWNPARWPPCDSGV